MSDCGLIPVDWLRERYAYHPLTGAITYRQGPSKLIGREAGYIDDKGYRVLKVTFNGRRIQFGAHRLAWALHHGHHPTLEVDHKDLNRSNNRLKNLRHATRSNNLANRPNTGPLPKGVTASRSKTKPFQAQVTIDGVYRYLGCHATAEEAHAAYLSAALPHHGEFLRVA
ncbi:HNH nuclease [Bajunvirus bajun]|uniref:HNH nuclease n=1 Tax=Brevundimonas phage vB_BgoS-Bajun TaxID=2948594 RepID=A0A9E7SRW0_9CAUD|nr:HNH nuclease [Brevundimonas phage vB_BgoS-Bajun]